MKILRLLFITVMLLSCDNKADESEISYDWDISGCCAIDGTAKRIITLNDSGDTVNVEIEVPKFRYVGVCNPPPPSVMTFECRVAPVTYIDSIAIAKKN